jgi:hypothetical protein
MRDEKLQADVNAKWRTTVQSDIGAWTFLQPPTRAVTGLRPPYQYKLPVKTVKELTLGLRSVIKYRPKLLQCGRVDSKPVTYGVRLDIFLLGYAPGLCGNTAFGATKEEWNLLTASIQDRLDLALGEAPMYVESWSAYRKFQARFETYIKFDEL